jgi:hypothetical protein
MDHSEMGGAHNHDLSYNFTHQFGSLFMAFKSRINQILSPDVEHIMNNNSAKLRIRFRGPNVNRLDVVAEIFNIISLPLSTTRAKNRAWQEFSQKYDLWLFEQLKASEYFREKYVPKVTSLRVGSIDTIIEGAGLVLAVIAAFTTEQQRQVVPKEIGKYWRRLFPPETEIDISVIADDETI